MTALFNHNEVGRRSLEDVIGIFGHQLRALGHRAVWDSQKDFTRTALGNDQYLEQFNFVSPRDGINIIVEGFTPWGIAKIQSAHERGARFIILATEEPSEKGFNQGTQPEMVRRQKTFPEAAKFCEGIIHLVPGEHVTKWYGQHAPAAYCELGYAPSLMRMALGEPDYDFGFYGSLTKRRYRILQKLANATMKANGVRIVADFKSQQERDQEMRRAKVIVQLRKFDEMGLVSSSRCNTALCIGRPVIAEPHLLSKPWDEIVRFSRTQESFVSEAMLMLAMWRGIHASQLEAFKRKLPPDACVGEALRQIGLKVDPLRMSA